MEERIWQFSLIKSSGGAEVYNEITQLEENRALLYSGSWCCLFFVRDALNPSFLVIALQPLWVSVLSTLGPKFKLPLDHNGIILASSLPPPHAPGTECCSLLFAITPSLFPTLWIPGLPGSAPVPFSMKQPTPLSSTYPTPPGWCPCLLSVLWKHPAIFQPYLLHRYYVYISKRRSTRILGHWALEPDSRVRILTPSLTLGQVTWPLGTGLPQR